MTKKASRSFGKTSKELLKNPKVAAKYLEEILADGDMELFTAALRDVADARVGSMTALSRGTHLNREATVQNLIKKRESKTGNPDRSSSCPGSNVVNYRLFSAFLKSPYQKIVGQEGQMGNSLISDYIVYIFYNCFLARSGNAERAIRRSPFSGFAFMNDAKSWTALA